MEFAFPEENCSAVLFRADIVNLGDEIEIDTITVFDGMAIPSHPNDESEKASQKKKSVDHNKDYGRIWKDMLNILTIEACLLLFMYWTGGISPSVTFFCNCLLVPATACILVYINAHGRGGWESVLINGWQSFSYAGIVSVRGYHSATGALMHALWHVGLLPSLQPCVQTGWAFSGAFHDGPPLLPRGLLACHRGSHRAS